MAQNWKVKIGTIWITSDGSETGRACKLDLRGAAGILQAKQGNTQISNSTLPFNESPVDNLGGGRPLEIVIQKLDTSIYSDLKTLLDAAATADPGDAAETFNITATGEPGAFDVEAMVFHNPDYFDFGLFIDGSVKAVVVRVITTEINSIS